VGLWEIQPQIILLMASLIIGLVTGLLFDIYRRIRNLVSPGPYLTALGDLCFWGLITAITFTSLLAISYGQVRGYVFFGIGAGLSLYLHFISRYVIVFFVVLDIYAFRFFMKASSFVNGVKKFKAFRLAGRILTDARRIFSKIKHK
jgi:spore cortex biosynthesis protein YabQ